MRHFLCALVIAAGLVAQAQAGEPQFTRRVEEIRRAMGARRIGFVFRDLAGGRRLAQREHELFAAASMIKAAVMVAVFDGVEKGRFALDTPVHVSNSFPRIGAGSVKGSPLDADVHAAIGGTLTVGQLTEAMVARSSNLATNVLLERIGLEEARRSLRANGVGGFTLGCGMGRGRVSGGNNVSAAGFEDLFLRLHAGQVISPEASKRMLDLLFAQAITNGIPAGLPVAVRRSARIAHKTGNIPTVEHDAALIYLPGRAPYLLVILTDWPERGDDHPACLVAVTRAAYEELIAPAR